MKYLIDFNGTFAELQASVEALGARVLPTHPLRYAAIALDAQAVSTQHHQSPTDYLRALAAQDGHDSPLAGAPHSPAAGPASRH